MTQKTVRPRSRLVPIWFALDAILALLPPIHWAITPHSPWIADMPLGLIYMGGLPIIIAASIVYAYWDDVSRGAF
ncbi:hypothetical protein [Acidisoma silvae]|uniref:DUF3311 domain-containing protein n=1 Tax=Acidisoma silvae TaxID=2802396 RepID=A0A963YSX8_9PROT|nr:hypothetical protein [Acidisoma silvae]MCB8875937.1 hypothetical protein [Acidisoma silvae]